jgi:glycosyltransferase involved in cell wall biosynthesis
MARVALVCEPPDGGVAEHVAQLAFGLAQHGHEPVVFGPPGLVTAERLARAGVPVRALRFRRDYAHPHRDAQALGQLVRAIRRDGFALVHAHAAKAGVLARIAAALTGRPAVYTPHGFPFVGEVSAARRHFGVGVERALGPMTAAIVCVCEQERALARTRGIAPAGPLAVVHNGCPSYDGIVPDADLAELRERGPLVGAVSVLRRSKRLDVLIDAAPRVLAAVPEATIAIIGDGPEQVALRTQAATLRVDIAFRPYREPSARALSALDVYVLSSSWEAFPIGVLEAQACGVPQVATDTGGTREAVVPETGVLVPRRDPNALADALIALLRDPDRRATMATASRARHAERFTVQRMVAATAAIYDEVLG